MQCAFSIIIPVYKELYCDDVLSSLLSLKGIENSEILFVDTVEKTTVIPNHPQVKVLYCPKKGRADQLNYGAKQAKGDILFFLHADSKLPENALEKITETLENPRYLAGTFTIHFNHEKKVYRVLERGVAWRIEKTRCPYGDHGLFLYKTYFEKIGGYPNISFMEDVEILKKVKKRKEEICILPEQISTSVRKYEQCGPLWNSFRNRCISTLYMLGFSHRILKLFYRYSTFRVK